MPAEIQDEFTNLPVSRELKRQMRAMRDGKCTVCGGKTTERKCPKCVEKELRRKRDRYRKKVAA